MKYKLKDLVTIKYGKNQKKVEDNLNGKIPILGTGGIIGYSKEFLYDKPSVLIGRKGTIDKIKFVDYPFWTIDTLFYTEINEKLILPQYLYYKLLGINFNNLNEGTTIPSLRTQTLYEIELDVDEMDIQRKVVKLLSLIDKKIKQNTRTNNNLYEIGLSLIEEEYNSINKTEKLQNIIKFTKGKKPVKIVKYKDKNYDKYLTIACLNYQELNYANKEKMILAQNDILMVMDGASSGEVYYSDCGIVGSTFARIDIINKIFTKEYMFFILKKYTDLIKTKNTGSAIPHADKAFINLLSVPILSIENQKKYCIILKKIQQNEHKIRNLMIIRDTLLPKLMNGEIDLDKIEI